MCMATTQIIVFVVDVFFAMPTTENTKVWTRPKLAKETTGGGDTCSFDNKQTYHSGTEDGPASVSDALITTTSNFYVAVLNFGS
jgi:hypothetical protein